MTDSIGNVVRSGLCISCGACCIGSGGKVADMHEDRASGMYYPRAYGVTGHQLDANVDVCPGAGYAIEKMAQERFPDTRHSSVLLGRWNQLHAARCVDAEILAAASSGGIMTAISLYLLEMGIVEGVVVSRFTYGDDGPRAVPIIATSRAALLSAQGSKYCPVPAVEILQDVENFNGRILFVGTPCQVAGVSLLRKKVPWIREKIPMTLANFCGGFRSFRETTAIIKRSGVAPRRVTAFRYRGDRQPGSMLIQDNQGSAKKLPYPQYSRLTGVTKNRRCRLCVDATGELADFSCGDAWISRFLDSEHSWSILLTRSTIADNIVSQMVEVGLLRLAGVSVQEVEASQEDNLHSKKVRQNARRRLYRMLGIRVPDFGGGYYRSRGGLLLELRVFVGQLILSILERLGLYPTFARIIGRYPKDLQ